MSNEILQEAIKSIKAGQRHRAKDLLTRLLRADQANTDYWLWMSAAVETEKEQIFCLQNALKIDPNSIAARRGLVVLGALKPEDAALPPPQSLENFQVEVPKTGREGGGSGGIGFLSRPRNRERLLIFGLGGVGLVLVIFLVGSLFRVLFPPKRVVIVTSAPPTQTLEVTLEPGVTPTVAPCSLPYDPDPNIPLASLLCLTQTPTSAPIPTEASVYGAYVNMRNGYRDGDWDKIISNMTEAIQQLPDNPRVYFYAAEAYRHKGDSANALKNYRLALTKDSNFAPAYWGRALAEIDQNKGPDALKDFASAMTADPNFYPAYLDRGLFYSANGNYPRAVSDLEQAKLVAPGNALVLAHLALAHMDSNLPESALETAEDAIAIDPGLALAYYARGRAEYALGQFEEADKDLNASYKYVLALDMLYPKLFQATVLYNYGLGKMGVGQDSTALLQFNQAITLRPNYPLAYIARGRVYLRTKDYDQARADFNKAISQIENSDDPVLPEAYIGNGLAFIGLNKPESAVSSFQVAAARAPQNFEAQLGLGQSLVLRNGANDPQDAIESLNIALDLAKDDSQKARVYYWRSRAYRTLRRTAAEAADLSALAALTDAPSDLLPTAEARLTEIGPVKTATTEPTATPTALETQATPTPAVTETTPTPTGTRAGSTTPATRTPTPKPSATSKTKTPVGTATRTVTPSRTPTSGPYP
jgi:tetratricopeptide (TPR) repeat protein